MSFRNLVERSFAQSQKCYGHCEQPADFRFLESGDPVVACFVCPAGYISKLMVYGSKDPLVKLTAFMRETGDLPLKEADVRTATRHPWDLSEPGIEMKAAYWTQNYRGSKSEDPNRPALFLCSRCGSPYVKPVSSSSTLCANCSR